MAYKLLVADDEYWVREKLRVIVEWTRYGIEFLEPACDGEEVLQRIETERPDILITDINMPGLSGVELLEHLAEEHTDMVMLVLSGYDTFDYVKRSMRSGAINYLLKPVSKIELVSAVSEALQILHDRQVLTEKQARQQEQMLWTSSLLQDRELSLLLDSQRAGAAPTLSMNVPLNVAGYRVVLMKIHDMSHMMGEYRNDINQLSYAVKSRLRTLWDTENAILFNHFFRSNEFILLADSAEQSSPETARRCMELLGALSGSPVTVVLSDRSYAMENIRAGYLRSVSRLLRRRYIPRSEVLMPDMAEQPDDGSLKWTEELEHKLSVYINNGNRKMAERVLLEETGLQNAQNSLTSCGAVRQLVDRMNRSLLASFNAAPDDAAAAENLAEDAARSVETLDMDRLFARESELIDAVLSGRSAEQTNTMRETVARIRQDIDEHYYEPLTLTSLAEKYFVERSYLSRCFKQETGENLMPYLTRRRIEKAMEHIREGKAGLMEISFLVGFDDYTYFSRVFKKFAGVSPREYKGRCRENGEGADAL